MMPEPWQYNPAYNTMIDLNGCQFGFEVDGRCNAVFCKFRTTRDLAPKEAMPIGRAVCPREREYNGVDAARIDNPNPTLV